MTEEQFSKLKFYIYNNLGNTREFMSLSAIKKEANRLKTVICFYKNVIIKATRRIDSMEHNLVSTERSKDILRQNQEKLKAAKSAFLNYNPKI